METVGVTRCSVKKMHQWASRPQILLQLKTVRGCAGGGRAASGTGENMKYN